MQEIKFKLQTRELTYSLRPFEIKARQAAHAGVVENPGDGVKKPDYEPGDWIITRRDGKQFCMSDKDFHAAYALVGDDDGEMGICIGCEEPIHIEKLIHMEDETACEPCFKEMVEDERTSELANKRLEEEFPKERE